MSENSKKWFQIILTPVVTIALFTLLNFFINPSRAIADQVSNHETRISIEEHNTIVLTEEMREVNRKLDKIIDLFIGDKK